MPDVVWVCGPIGFHLWEKVRLKNSLRFADRGFNRIWFLRVQLAVAGSIKRVEVRGNCVEGLLFRGVRLIQDFDCFPLEIRQCGIETACRERLIERDIGR